MEISEHFRELRARLLVCFFLFIGISAAAFHFAPSLWDYALRPLSGTGSITLANLSPAEGISANLILACFFGALIGAPVFLYHAYAFCAPAISEADRANVPKFVVVSTVLFFAGMAFAYFLALPFLFQFLAGYSTNAVPLWSQESYIAFFLRFEILFALVFQMPVLAAFLARAGIADKNFPARHFRIVIFLTALFSAIVTPPDILSLVWVAVPILALYAIGVLAYRIFWRER